MKMTLRTAELSRALYRVQGIADKRSTMPILAHVLLDARNGENLIVSATDLDVGLSGTYDAEIVSPGSVAIHARHLYDIVKSLPKETVQFERQENNWVELRSGTSRFRLVGMAPDEFPELPSYSQVPCFDISAPELGRMIDRTVFCVSTDDNRHNLSGVYCEAPEPTMLRMVATDGHRLAMSEHTFKSELTIPHGVIVPKKGFQELRRVLSDGSEDIGIVQLGFSGNSGVLKAGSVVLSTRLVEGQFPDYRQVIPDAGTKFARLHRSRLAEALKRVSLLSQGRAYGVRLNFDKGNLELKAEDPEFGDAQELVEMEYEGEPVSIGFNARYLLEVLNLIQDDGILIELSDDLSPGVIKPLSQGGFLAVVMPMRI